MITGTVLVHSNPTMAHAAIGSILSQSKPVNKLNIVITNADQNVYEQFRHYENETTSVYKSSTKLNIPLSKALCMSLVNTKYGFILDDDDTLHKTYIEQAMPFMLNNYNLISSNYLVINRVGHYQLASFENISPYAQNIYHCASIVNKQVYDLVGSYNKNYLVYQDYQLWLRIYKYNPELVYTIPSPLLHYYVHGKNISSNSDKNHSEKQIKEFIKYLLN